MLEDNYYLLLRFNDLRLEEDPGLIQCCDHEWYVHDDSLVCWSVRRFCTGMMQVMLDPSALRIRVGYVRFGVCRVMGGFIGVFLVFHSLEMIDIMSIVVLCALQYICGFHRGSCLPRSDVGLQVKPSWNLSRTNTWWCILQPCCLSPSSSFPLSTYL